MYNVRETSRPSDSVYNRCQRAVGNGVRQVLARRLGWRDGWRCSAPVLSIRRFVEEQEGAHTHSGSLRLIHESVR